MLLLRLRKWFSDTFSRIAFHLRDALTYDAEREPVMSGHTRTTAHTSYMSTDYLLPPNWLEDARRLRPQLLAPDMSQQRRPLEKQPLDAAEKEQLSGQSLTTGANDPAARVGAQQLQQPPRPTPPSQPIRAIPLSPADVAAHHDTLDDALLHRRLMSLKHLVRLGVYNEGFTSGRIPEQYHRSLGIDGYDDMGGLGED